MAETYQFKIINLIATLAIIALLSLSQRFVLCKKVCRGDLLETVSLSLSTDSNDINDTDNITILNLMIVLLFSFRQL